MKPVDCGDCKAPITEPWHYRCWWCKVAFCRDCAARHFGGPGDAHSVAQAERIKQALSDERARIVKLIEDEQAFLTTGDKRMLIERLLESWSRQS